MLNNKQDYVDVPSLYRAKVKLNSALCEEVEVDGENASILKEEESMNLEQEYKEVGFLDILKSKALLIRLLVCIYFMNDYKSLS